MSKAWIEELAGELKTKGRDAAESYGREQHRAGIIDAEGKVFFTALVTALEQDIAEMRAQLQGSAIACETSVQRESPSAVRLTRSRFPWFDATVKHDAATIALDYAQGRGVATEQDLAISSDRKAVHFAFAVDAQDKLSIAEAFGDSPRSFQQSDELARHILELLFHI